MSVCETMFAMVSAALIVGIVVGLALEVRSVVKEVRHEDSRTCGM